MSELSDIIASASALSREDRSFLARKLLESLEQDEPISDELYHTLQQRSHELRDGSSEPLSFTQLRESIGKYLGK